MRTSGVLMPISSLPSPYGIGTMGKSARKFVDFLVKGGQTYWQILPICPTSYGDSPYQSFSSFAGNPYFIDLDILCKENLLKKKECESFDWGTSEEYIDYGTMYVSRYALLHKAYARFVKNMPEDFSSFCEAEKDWLEDYTLFMALKDANDGKAWGQWDEKLRVRDAAALDEARKKYAEDIEFYKMLQYLFFKQWRELKAYANENGIEIIGDVPIYVAGDSADVWANKEIFKLNPELKASELAGCPPDCFSPDGQLWGNPVYDWKKLKKQKYSWWIERLNQSFKIYDIVRIDHFRGFESYYSVKAGSNTARKGLWRKGGGKSFFDALPKEFKNKIIAENLGFLTKEVDELLKYTGFPGMKVLQFSFDSRDDNGKSLPDDFEKNNVVYTGTHDNDTVLGWCNTADKKDVAYAMRYLGAKDKFDLVDKMNECAMNSNANTCILTMQDLLCLGSEARMNTPSTMGENWKWRMSKDDLTSSLANKLLDITKKSGRCVNG